MKKFILFSSIFLLFAGPLAAQKYLTRTGHTWFFSSTPVEDIEAHNHQVTSILDTENGELVFSLLMKSFQFEKALMQEHFNEKYVESEKFPKSTFKGKITNLDAIDFSQDGEYKTQVEGELSIHGVSQSIQAKGKLIVSGQSIEAKAEFPVKVEDYEIEIPSVVRDNIAEEILVTVAMKYEPFKKNGK
jgi:hypothetical protein